MAFELIASLTEPILDFTDDLFTTSEETAQYGIAQTNANASQTAADAQLIASQDAATFTPDEQQQLMYIIFGVVVVILIAGIFYTLNKN